MDPLAAGARIQLYQENMARTKPARSHPLGADRSNSIFSPLGPRRVPGPPEFFYHRFVLLVDHAAIKLVEFRQHVLVFVFGEVGPRCRKEDLVLLFDVLRIEFHERPKIVRNLVQEADSSPFR